MGWPGQWGASAARLVVWTSGRAWLVRCKRRPVAWFAREGKIGRFPGGAPRVQVRGHAAIETVSMHVLPEMHATNGILHVAWLERTNQPNMVEMHAAGLADGGLVPWCEPGPTEKQTNQALKSQNSKMCSEHGSSVIFEIWSYIAVLLFAGTCGIQGGDAA